MSSGCFLWADDMEGLGRLNGALSYKKRKTFSYLRFIDFI